jgi:hypothetical protein
VLLTKDHPEDEKCRQQLHALGFVEGHEGELSLRVKFYLTDDSQAGNTAGQERCARQGKGAVTEGLGGACRCRSADLCTSGDTWLCKLGVVENVKVVRYPCSGGGHVIGRWQRTS